MQGIETSKKELFSLCMKIETNIIDFEKKNVFHICIFYILVI
jgi:hypothetical protein